MPPTIGPHKIPHRLRMDQLGDTELTECVTSILEGALRMPTKLYAIVGKSEPVAESVKKP
jgi:hypothetical protein